MSPGYNASCPSGTPELDVTHEMRETTLHIHKQDWNINVRVLQINTILHGNSQANYFGDASCSIYDISHHSSGASGLNYRINP